MLQTKDGFRTITLDLEGVRSTRVRSTLRSLLDDLTQGTAAHEGSWEALVSGKPMEVPGRLVVMTDLSSCASMFKGVPSARWTRAVAEAHPFILAFVRTKRDQRHAALVDDIMSASLNRVRVCHVDLQATDRLRGCVSRALAAVDPESVVDVRYSEGAGSLWVEFGDGLKAILTWKRLRLEGLEPALLPGTARVGEELDAIQVLREDDSIFEIDALSVRSLVEPRTRQKVAEQDSASLGSVGRKLREKRRGLGLTQTALAEKSRLDQPLISKLERGKHCPRFDTLERYAGGLGLSVAELLE